jgi:hypothetical protein
MTLMELLGQGVHDTTNGIGKFFHELFFPKGNIEDNLRRVNGYAPVAPPQPQQQVQQQPQQPQQPQPTPRTQADLDEVARRWRAGLPTGQQPQATPMPTPTPTPTPHPYPTPYGQIPGGIDLASKYIQRMTPAGQSLEQYYPAYGDQQFMNELRAADQKRQGLSNLLMLQSFFESTGGRGGHGTFGAKPQGQTANFATPSDALHYQMGPSMLGGGGNPNMNILGSHQPLTIDDVRRLYTSYDPPGAYIDPLIGVLGGGE